MEEQGVGDLEVRSSLPLMGQKDLADSVVERLNEAVNVALADPETRKRLLTAYIEPQPMSPKELAAWLERERERLGGMSQAGNQGGRRLVHSPMARLLANGAA
jgi:tripartite-type tricarboxylate transporter receptor subunit TctC